MIKTASEYVVGLEKARTLILDALAVLRECALYNEKHLYKRGICFVVGAIYCAKETLLQIIPLTKEEINRFRTEWEGPR